MPNLERERENPPETNGRHVVSAGGEGSEWGRAENGGRSKRTEGGRYHPAPRRSPNKKKASSQIRFWFGGCLFNVLASLLKEVKKREARRHMGAQIRTFFLF